MSAPPSKEKTPEPTSILATLAAWFARLLRTYMYDCTDPAHYVVPKFTWVPVTRSPTRRE